MGREAAQRLRDKRRAEGLCGQCGKVPTPGGKQCDNCRQYQNAYRAANLEQAREHANAHNRRVRDEVLAHYGGCCACCGEPERAFLTIDHIDGNGMAHRRSLGLTGSGYAFHKWLRANGFPPAFQVLCWNCNMGKGRTGGVCPHQR